MCVSFDFVLTSLEYHIIQIPLSFHMLCLDGSLLKMELLVHFFPLLSKWSSAFTFWRRVLLRYPFFINDLSVPWSRGCICYVLFITYILPIYIYYMYIYIYIYNTQMSSLVKYPLIFYSMSRPILDEGKRAKSKVVMALVFVSS